MVQQGQWLRWSSGLQVDADGDPRAYHPSDWGPRIPGRQPLGLDAPENAGRPLDPSAPGPGTWPGVVASGAPGAQVPLVQSGQAPAQPFAGYWLSKTALQDSRYPSNDVRRYISSSAIPYIAVPPELRKLGVLSAAAYTLSGDALAHAVTPKAIFLYTLRQLLPWLQRAAELGVLVARASAGGRESDGGRGLDLPAPSLTLEPPAAQDDPLLRALVETTQTLTRVLARRSGLRERD